MKVLLVNPPQPLAAAQRMLENVMPPLNLMYLASALRRAGHEPRILDLYARPLPDAEALRAVRDFSPSLVGFATYPAGIDQVYALARAIRALEPGVRIVLGGLYASYLPEICLALCPADAVVLGEGETTLAALAAALESGADLAGVEGICWRRDGAAAYTRPRAVADDLDALAWPAYDLVDLDVYRLPPTRAVTNGRVSSILSARGCSFNCSFCSHHYGYQGRVRARRPEDVVDEMQHVVERYGVGEFRFEDCTLTADPDRALRICALIMARGLAVVWNCDVRADTASDELFAALRAAGCRRVFLGVESGSARMLGEGGADKPIRLEQVRGAVRLAKKHGLRINCSFVLGLPGETLETAWESYRFALELDPDYAMFSILVPVVGSQLFARAVREGKIDVARYRGAHYLPAYAHGVDAVELSELKADALVGLMRSFNRGFYSRPGYLLKRLASVRSLTELQGLLWGARHIFSGRRTPPAAEAGGAG